MPLVLGARAASSTKSEILLPVILAPLYFLATAFIAYWATYLLIGWLTEHNIIAMPTRRSCHTSDTPVGGGWVLFSLTFLAWAYYITPLGSASDFLVLIGMLCLALISWLDDKHFVSPLLRFIIQAITLIVILLSLPSNQLVFAGILPMPLDRLVTFFFWLWFVNLYNFMDGIDGLAGSQTLFIAIGLALVNSIIPDPLPSAYLPVLMVIAGASAGFLYWNWQPAKIFMGDVGSISMGFLLGWLLITLAIRGYLVTAMLLPLYFVVDASWTLLRRIVQRKKFLRPHRTHFYQKAALATQSHALVVRSIMLANLFLLGSAIWATFSPVSAIIMASVIMILLLFYLYSLFRDTPLPKGNWPDE